MNIYTCTLILKSQKLCRNNFRLPLLSNLVHSLRHPTPSCFTGFSDNPRFLSFFLCLNFFPKPKHGPNSLASCVSPAECPTRLRTHFSKSVRPCALHHARALLALRPHHAMQPTQIRPSPASYACAESPGLSGPRRPHAPREMENHPWPVHNYSVCFAEIWMMLISCERKTLFLR
jgi:hypothetical protein